MPTNELKGTVETIAQQLGESKHGPRATIRRIVQRLGVETALAFLEETLEIEQSGGLLTADGRRRRTPGGVFFYLVRKRISVQDRSHIFYRPARKAKARAKPQPAFKWNERLRVIGKSLQARADATTVKITLVGRPGRLVETESCVITTLQSSQVPDLPKGLPTPPDTPTTYVVYIAQKHWQKVAQAIEDPEDALIVQGFAAFDPEVKGLAVFAMNATTKRLQAARRQKPA